MLIIVLLDFRPRVYIGFSGPGNDIDRNKRTLIILLHKSVNMNFIQLKSLSVVFNQARSESKKCHMTVYKPIELCIFKTVM